MSSSLASQLRNIASIDASRLTSRYGQPSSKSYLFPPKVAESHDLDAVHALGQSGFDELVQLDAGMEEFEQELFSEAAKRTDRMVMSKEENAELDKTLERCLRRLGKWIGIMAGGKCIEWLVRRFRVHELNAEAVLQVFLPYHESQNFARILAILTIPTSSPYSAPFAALAKRAQPVPREYITSAISSARDPSLQLLTDVAGSLKKAIDEKVVHRAHLAFWSATLVDLLERSRAGGRPAEGVVKILVENFVTILSEPDIGADANAAVYPPLVLLTRAIRLADEPFAAIVQAILTPNTGASPSQRILTLLVILDSRKGWTEGLGEDAAAHLSKIPHLGELLVSAMEKYGFETAMGVIVPVLIDDLDASNKILATIFDYPALADSVIQAAANKLLETDSDDLEVARSLLSTLRQRHPTVIDNALTEAQSTSEVDPALIQWTSAESAFVDVHSADVASRVSGIKEMYAVAESAELTAANAVQLLGSDADDKLKSAQAAVIARLGDADTSVLKTLYGQPDLLLALLTGTDYVDVVATAFIATKPKPELLGLHLSFIAESYLPAHPEAGQKVFDRLLIPNLLATEERRAFGPQQWPAVIGASHLLKGVKGNGLPPNASKEELVTFNQELVKSLSAALAVSGDIGSRVDSLVNSLSSSSAAARLLAALTLAQLMSVPGGYQHVVAARALAAIEANLAGKPLKDVDEIESPLSDDLVKAIVTKPTAAKTQQRAYLALLTSAAAVQAQPNATTSWLGDLTGADGAEAQVRSVTHSLYRWANSSNLSDGVSRHLLQAVLSQLGEDGLIFLASVWTSATDAALRVAALRHATAFVNAYTKQSSSAKPTDFQLAVPATLVALQDEAKAVRQAAGGLLKAISQSPQSSNANIYALDTFYGPRSEVVQLLKPSDLTKYIQVLLRATDEMTIDARRLALIHGAALDDSARHGKKEVSYRRDVVDWLMSHALGWRAGSPRLSLLSSIAQTTNNSRLQSALPLLTPLTDFTKDEAAWLASLPEADSTEYLELIFEAFDAKSASLVTAPNSESWKFLLDLVSVPPTGVALRLYNLALQRMDDGLFAALKPAQKVEYIEALIKNLNTLTIDDKLASKALLANLILGGAEIVNVLEDLLQPLEAPSHRGKKAKHDSDDADRAESAVAHLTVFVESRDWKALPGDASVVASLMNVLSSVLNKRQTIKEGVDYLEQEVLGAVLAQIEQIQDAGEILRARVGIEVIVKVVRATSNPRTAQRALLVASELARLIPDSVLHNVMPIFTFMGSSDLQRDDAFSFGVVEKTVERIVPVMAKSLIDKAGDDTLSLYTESRAFLSIFTDMATRLPKHRTLPFFVHLVKSLGPALFLAPVCMLLADRGTVKKGSASAALELPISLAAMFKAALRTEAVLETIRETARLVEVLESDDAEEGSFLCMPGTEDDARTRRQVDALLELSTGLEKQLIGKACPQPTVEEIVSALISLSANVAVLPNATETSERLDAVLSSAMQLLSVGSFLDITVKILDSGATDDINRALDLFAERLPLIKPELRAKSVPTMVKFIRSTAALLSKSDTSAATARRAIYALDRVASTAITPENNALSATVSIVVGAVKTGSAEVKADSLNLLSVLVRHLASRAIPFIQPVLQAALDSVKDSKSAAPIVEAAFGAIASLVETVPTFVSTKQLVSILTAAAAHRAVDQAASSSLIITVAKRIPTKTLVPVVMDLWKTLLDAKAGQDAIEAFFYLLKQTLRHADSKQLPNYTRRLFAFFLDVFDLRSKPAGKAMEAGALDAAEASAITSFCELVTKLSEAAFKPLFQRLYDWAVVDLPGGPADAHVVARRSVFVRVMSGLLAKFRSLLTPYMATVLPFVDELLAAYSAESVSDEALWALTLDMVTRSIDVDDGAFWTDASLLKLLPALISQLSLFPAQTTSSSSPVAKALAALMATTSNEASLKKANNALLLSTRADEPQARMASLRALDAAWERHADELIQFVPETVSEFLAELLEDENAEVEGLARKVLARIEGVTGSLAEYLE